MLLLIQICAKLIFFFNYLYRCMKISRCKDIYIFGDIMRETTIGSKEF